MDRPAAASSATRWGVIERLFTRAIDLPPAKRDEFLAAAFSDDNELQQEVRKLLAAHDAVVAQGGAGERFLEQLDAERAAALVQPPEEIQEIGRAIREALGDRYTIERPLGSGGMAEVFAARDLRHDRLVAIKVVREDCATPRLEHRFEREVRIAARLQHPHIVPLYDSGVAAGHRYYVMPLVDGPSLRQRLGDEKRLPLAEVLRIVEEVAGALDYAHGSGIVHRDIKPENILLSRGHALVADFGIARAAVETPGFSTLTAAGLAVGTPAYMSPEQAAGQRVVDGRSDQYALACVAYELLTGRPPFTGETARAVMGKHVLERVPPLELGPALPSRALDEVMARALAKDPAERFATTVDFASALRAASTRDDRVGEEPRASSEVATPTRAPMLLARMSRRPWQVALFAAAVIIIGATVLMLRASGEPRPTSSPGYQRTAIAVLPFDNLSAEGSHAYFAGGLHDELQTQLSKVAALKVISRTSVRSYAGTSTPLGQIATELRVGSVVEGSVRVVGQRLRVNVALVDAATGAQLWAERYDRTVDDAFAIQSDVAQKIVVGVGAVLTHVEQQGLAEPPTANAEAYRLYLQGREYVTRPGYIRQNIEIAQRFFERALSLDRDFALARAALSEVHGRMYWYRYDPSPARAVRQVTEAEAALRLAPDLPEAHVAMGLAHFWGRRDYRRALEEFGIALKGLPNDAKVWSWIGYVHRRTGNWDEAIGAFEHAARLDPRDANLFFNLGGSTLVTLHRYADAVRAFDNALSLAPDHYGAAIWKGWTYVRWQGRLDTLRAILGRVPRDADLAGLGTRAAQHVQLLYWERQADSALQVLAAAPVGVFESSFFFLPKSLHAGSAHQLRGEGRAARAAFDSARVLLDSVAGQLPDDWRVHAARGLALAGLGRRDEAIREAHWLHQSPAHREDAFYRPWIAEDRARILAQAGESDAALDEIERLLSMPSFLSVHALRLDPLWDPIRDHPRFKALLAKYGAR